MCRGTLARQMKCSRAVAVSPQAQSAEGISCDCPKFKQLEFFGLHFILRHFIIGHKSVLTCVVGVIQRRKGMKKYVILTSVFALAACGGGSGGHHGGGAAPIVPDASVTPEKPFITDSVAESNSEITSMVSNSEAQVVTYVVGKLGEDAESVGLGNLARTATTRAASVPSALSGGMDYDRAKELMELAQWLGDETTTYDDIVAMFNNSKTDQNKIKSALKLLDDMYCYVGGSADETATRILERRAAKDFEKPMAEIKEKSEILTLDGVDLYVTPWSDTLTRLKFNLKSDGTIESIEYPDADKIIAEQPDADIAVGPMYRDGETASFIEKSTLTKEEMTDDDGDGNMVSPEYVKGDVHANFKHEYVSYAKGLGLKYSDFGVLRTDFSKATFNADALTPEGQEELREFLNAWGVGIEPFAGGYKDKAVDNDRMTELAQNGEIKFSGLAVGDVRVRDQNAYNGNGIDIPLTSEPMRDNNATLVFDKEGAQTLTADFSDDWYKIQVIKNADGTDSFKIVDGKGGADERFHLDPTKLANNITDSVDGNPYDMNNPNYDAHNSMVFTTGYYGDNGNPDEAVALVNYQYSPKDMIEVKDENGNIHYKDNPDGNIGVVLGFGGTKK